MSYFKKEKSHEEYETLRMKYSWMLITPRALGILSLNDEQKIYLVNWMRDNKLDLDDDIKGTLLHEGDYPLVKLLEK